MIVSLGVRAGIRIGFVFGPGLAARTALLGLASAQLIKKVVEHVAHATSLAQRRNATRPLSPDRPGPKPPVERRRSPDRPTEARGGAGSAETGAGKRQRPIEKRAAIGGCALSRQGEGSRP